MDQAYSQALMNPPYATVGARARTLVKSGGAPVTLVVVALLLRVPFLAELFAHPDAAQYAIGIHRFDPLDHHPHPPGSPIYILMARAVFWAVGDENRSLVLISLLGSAAAVGCMYLLTMVLAGRLAALLATIAFLSQPMFWAYGTMASAWTLLAFLSLLFGGCCFLLQRGKRELALPSGLLLGLLGGVRADITLFLAPVWLWSLWQGEPRATRRAAAMGLAAVGVAAWLVPVAWATGGLGPWVDGSLRLFFPDTARPPESGLDHLRVAATNTAILVGIAASTFGLLLGLGALLGKNELVAQLRTWPGRRLGLFLVLWCAPSALFLWAVDMTEAGHSLLYTVALYPFAAGLLVRMKAPRRRLLAGVAAIVLMQAAIFLGLEPRSSGPLTFTMNSVLLDFTAPALRQQQQTLHHTLAVLQGMDPSHTVIATVNGGHYYRYLMFYLPDFRVVRMDGPDSGLSASRWEHTERRDGCILHTSTAPTDQLVLVWEQPSVHLGVHGDLRPADALRAQHYGVEVLRLPDTPKCTFTFR